VSDDLPTLIVDSREKLALPFSRLQTRRAALQVGDYSIEGLEALFAVERKSLDDLAACCGACRERFERQLSNLSQRRFRRLLIVGRTTDLSGITRPPILSALGAWEVRFDVPVMWIDTPDRAGALVERWATYFWREFQPNREAPPQPALALATQL
jgi:ERCC4-type nuclease